MPRVGEWEWDELLTRQEVADLARVHLRTFERWRQQGNAPPEIKLGPGAVRYASSDVQRWIEARKRLPVERVA